MKKQILITVKAYPNSSTKYGETVCCAGIDLSDNQLIRLYPIPYRDLDDDKKFRKYSIIEGDCWKANDDKRPESYKVNPDSIKIIEVIKPNSKWKKRKSIILKVPVKSMCQILRESNQNDISLGLIKPENISFDWKKQSPSNMQAREACYAQLSFFNKYKDAIEDIPYNFYYSFHCAGDNSCTGHRLCIVDWEIGQAYRFWRSRYEDEETRLEKIKQKWDEISDITKKDVYFYVGNLKRFRDKFMILGVFYPPH